MRARGFIRGVPGAAEGGVRHAVVLRRMQESRDHEAARLEAVVREHRGVAHDEPDFVVDIRLLEEPHKGDRGRELGQELTDRVP
eukprot:6910628-Prymnesium_polylepis.3